MSDFYLLDGVPIAWNELVKKARTEYGYETGGFYQTSVAADILRKNGHTVEDVPREASHD